LPENQSYSDLELFLELEKHKKEITESLKYASYIQQALLPDSSFIKRLIPDHFILFLPRDIVSGDFYWIVRRKNELILAVADCTGHGVPGAFMSILGITFLNQIVNKGDYYSAAGILNELREHVMKALNQRGKESEQKDGMDMSICRILPEENILEYSGAFNPLYILTKNNIKEIPGDKMPIGIGAFEEKSFTNRKIYLNQGDLIYLFSDGYADQFGGKNGKKLKYRPFRKILFEIKDKPMHEQRNVLLEKYKTWKGNFPQLDDILIFGFRYVSFD
jgi:serine phosphatase RsbU (regulator of sigma subunit)